MYNYAEVFFMNERIEENHTISSQNREGLIVSGVKDVVSFDERGAVMETVCGNMAVEGGELQVTVLDLASGKVEIKGRLDAVYYFENKPTAKKGLFGKRDA